MELGVRVRGKGFPHLPRLSCRIQPDFRRGGLFRVARPKDLFLTVPGSEQLARRAILEEERMLYRLVLGMSDQADLLELIASREEWDSSTIREASLDLSALTLS